MDDNLLRRIGGVDQLDSQVVIFGEGHPRRGSFWEMILVRAAVLALLANRLQRHREARDEATCDEADRRRQLRPTAHVRADRGLRTLTV